MEVLGEVSSFCRFCLSQDCETLMPLSSVIENLSFSVQDILETTGISIFETETAYLAVCTKCSQRIELAVDFRRSCIEGNVKFLRLFCHIIDKVRSSEIAEKHLNDAAYLKNDPLKIDNNLHNEPTNENTYKAHDEPALPAEESIELFNDDDRCKVESSGSEDLPDAPTNTLEPNRNLANTGVAATASNSKKEKSNERVKENYEDKPTKPIKRKKSGKNRKQLCGICGALVYKLHDHTRSHTKENLHKCQLCPVQMASESNLRTHVRLVHQKVVVKTCEPCGKGFITYNAYTAHMLAQHNIGKQYQCEVCLKKFNTTACRTQHIKRMHIGELKYECEICQKKFKDKNSLKRHGRVHSTNAPYACSLCPKRFKSPFAKKVHETVHSGIQFACTICTKVYRYKSQLSMHYRKHHPVECGGESA
ncbi:zinc finger protein 235-like isoform X1 [Anopheles albimanus]|uniref:zinc finger protein 235-like isoform X1 n=1 Tax=Anopheles albimanus TaxID=7167 RepID=UPI00164223F3|nr:zinc finger protein 235-like isoform X1 [Anopheles albimanus]